MDGVLPFAKGSIKHRQCRLIVFSLRIRFLLYGLVLFCAVQLFSCYSSKYIFHDKHVFNQLVTGSILSYMHVYSTEESYFQCFPINSKAKASEFLENIEEMFPSLLVLTSGSWTWINVRILSQQSPVSKGLGYSWDSEENSSVFLKSLEGTILWTLLFFCPD